MIIAIFPRLYVTGNQKIQIRNTCKPATCLNTARRQSKLTLADTRTYQRFLFCSSEIYILLDIPLLFISLLLLIQLGLR